MVAIYLPVFRKGSPEALLNFFTLLHKIIQGQDLSTGPQNFGVTSNLVIVEALRVFEQNNWDRGAETNAKYELVMEDFIAHFFPSKVLKSQKRYLRRGLYKPCDRNIREFICRIDEMVDYL